MSACLASTRRERLSPARHQSEPPPPGNSYPRQSPPKAADADPSIVVDPSMPASFTGTDTESEITADGNPLSIQTDRKTL
jgi:hypothetical protein